jgi:hypothetical protein
MLVAPLLVAGPGPLEEGDAGVVARSCLVLCSSAVVTSSENDFGGSSFSHLKELSIVDQTPPSHQSCRLVECGGANFPTHYLL